MVGVTFATLEPSFNRLVALIHATLENWQYNDVIRRAADPECAEYLEKATEFIDDVLFNGISRRRLKDLFGLADLRHDDDFASLITVRPFRGFALTGSQRPSILASSRPMGIQDLASQCRCQ